MKRIVKIFLLIDIFLILLFLFIRFYLPSFLVYNNPVESKIVVVESWISAYEIERIVEYLHKEPEAQCLVVGKNYLSQAGSFVDKGSLESNHKNKDKKDIWLLVNSSLFFNITEMPIFQRGDSVTISVNAKGTRAATHFPYFNVIINDKVEKGFFVNDVYGEYSFKTSIPETGIQSILLRFTNDIFTGGMDRNLNIYSIMIDDFEILATSESTYEMEEQTKEFTGFRSQPDEVANYLIALGVNPHQIKELSFDPVEMNQTLASAKALKGYISKNNITNLNVLSSGFHSRRTWFTYHKMLESEVEVGTIYYPPVNYLQENWFNHFFGYVDIVHEYLSYLVNWFTIS